jgi:hemerythrin-like domain-containing protein
MPVQRKRSGGNGNRGNGSRSRSNSRSGGRSTQTDAITLLKQDHATVKKLLKQLESAEDSDSRQELLQKVETEVKVHTQIEEELFYPAFKEAARSEKEEEIYFEALEEHHVVDLVMPEIKDTDADDETFAAKAKVLKDLIEHHAEEEETQMFPKARKLMGMEELRMLGGQLQERKQELSDEQEMPRGGRSRRRRAA